MLAACMTSPSRSLSPTVGCVSQYFVGECPSDPVTALSQDVNALKYVDKPDATDPNLGYTCCVGDLCNQAVFNLTG